MDAHDARDTLLLDAERIIFALQDKGVVFGVGVDNTLVIDIDDMRRLTSDELSTIAMYCDPILCVLAAQDVCDQMKVLR